jgi:SSS family solute:Na+ symporter
MSSKAAELNALASTSLIDIYKRSVRKDAPDAHYLAASRWLTVFWGILAIVFAVFASMLDNLIQAVNILGSLFYGPILGIFAVAFYVKYIRGNAVFMAAILAEAVVFWCYLNTKIAYLWFNVIGCVAVLVFGLLLEWLIRQKNPVEQSN